MLLGSDWDLHPGYHGSLLSDPLEGIQYSKRSAQHIFLVSKRLRFAPPFSPHRYPHWGEFVDFDIGPEIVHSAKFPVLKRRAWIVDMDDFAYPVVMGRYAWNPEYRQFYYGNSPHFQTYLRQRAYCMLAAYAHISCKAILFWSERGVRRAGMWLEHLEARAMGETILRKCRVLYPAQRALPEDLVKEKWKGGCAHAGCFLWNRL